MLTAALLALALASEAPAAPQAVETQAAETQAAEPPAKVAVFVLAGQSNMCGYGQTASLPRLGEHPEHSSLLGRMRAGGGDAWIVRDDVHVAWLSSEHRTSGPLTVGWGQRETMVGPELAFGLEAGDAIDAPVLLIKTCWGGRDAYCDFRSPSSGEPEGAAAGLLAEERERDGRVREVGRSYRAMLREVDTVLADIGAHVPGYAGQGYELRGLAWFQGWNDYCVWHDWPGIIDQYPGHLAALFQDLRAELGAPDLPIVVGELGVHGTSVAQRAENGHGPSQAMARFRKAQRDACETPGLAHVTFVPTAAFWDERLAELSAQKDRWEQECDRTGTQSDLELPTEALSAEYRRLGGHWECHYNGSAANYCMVGAALAKALLSQR